MIKGFDCSVRLTAEQAAKMRTQGYEYAIRYCVPDNPKSITKTEADALLSAGLGIGLCWETYATRANSGAAGGLTDGKLAKEYAQSIGAPDTTVIYFAVDYDAREFDKIASYMIAAECAVRPYRLGVYGSYYVVEEMHRRGIGAAYWQCVAWSKGQWSEFADVQQREWGVRAVVDIDINYADNMDTMWSGKGMTITGNSIKLYNNTKKKKPSAILKETGASGIINGGLFNLAKWTPACHLKIDGTVLAADQYKYWGYGIKAGKAKLVQDYEDFPDYIACCCMVREGKPEKLIYNADMGGARQRTALGTFPDGTAWGYATLRATTPEQLQQIALAAGVRDAIMLDGGASTWAIGASELKGGRVAHNYVLFFDDCPFAEPKSNIRMGSIGTGAKWTQWMLNLYGYGLTVDGIFGTKSRAALIDFQRNHGLDADGICGPMTRTALKNGR